MTVFKNLRTNTMKIVNYIRNPQVFANVVLNHLSPLIKDDELFIKLKWRFNMDYPLDLDHPKTFSEKLQWLKLYDRRPEYTRMVDKVETKKYVAEMIGEQYIIPTLGVWENSEDIDFKTLPNQFVLKCNHNSGRGMYVCKDKLEMDVAKVRKELSKGLQGDYYFKGREWPYKNVKRLILAEKYLTEGEGELTDYKFFCFGGEPKYCQVIKDRHTKETIDFFDMEWNRQNFIGLNSAAVPAAVIPAKPKRLMKMQEIAKVLSKDIPFLRVDLYEVQGKVYFGEITFFPLSGFGYFIPREWDYTLGSCVVLPNDKRIA